MAVRPEVVKDRVVELIDDLIEGMTQAEYDETINLIYDEIMERFDLDDDDEEDDDDDDDGEDEDDDEDMPRSPGPGRQIEVPIELC